jgi:predicted O-methyltransferase YrrM
MLRLRAVNPNQDRDELADFVGLARSLDVRRYLEIGSRWGDSFYAVMANLRPGAFGMIIDLPENLGGERRLRETAVEIEELGSRVELVFASSRDASSKAAAALRCAPFDLVLIDADHRYDGVKADWLDYGKFAPVIAFHDIAAPEGHQSDWRENEVGRFWNELRGQHVTREIIKPGSNMGYGIVFH